MPTPTDLYAPARLARALKRLLAPLARASLLVLLLCADAGAQVPPDARWRTLDTPHFRVNFMVGLEPLARRTAARAEWAYGLLSRELVEPPAGRIDIVLTDAVDYANGSATPFPTNRITLYAHPPTDVTELSFTTDWLELLVLHELVHIFHLDEAEGIWGALRTVLGRNPALFPNLFAPTWMHEGLATWYESRFTPGGRVRGTLFEMVLRTAMLQDDFFTIDRATGEPRSWPGGSTRYVYGSLFLDFLAQQFGEEKLPALVEEYSGQIVPYRLNAAARRTMGSSLSAAWEQWRDSLRVHYRAEAARVAQGGLTEPEILTPAGRDAYHPRWSPDGSAIAYSAATGRDEPAVRLLRPGEDEREIAPRAELGPLDWTGDGSAVLYGDFQFRGPYRIYSDLYLAQAGGGNERRLTRAARVAQPDLHPDGRTVAAVHAEGGTNVLVVGDLHAGALRPLIEASPGVHWGHPRWSPNGERLAAMRWSPGGLHDIVLLDRSGRVLREITHDRAIDASPAWSPDGRYVLFWSDRTGIPNLFAWEVEAERLFQVTRVVTGAFDPDVSPDGRWIAFSYYQADGYHIARLPMEPQRWSPAPPPREEALPLDTIRSHPPLGGETRAYSPWPSVAPATWSLLTSAGTALGPGFGITLAGVDVVRRHLWAAEALVYTQGGRFDGGAIYRYQGWGNPALEVAASQDWTALCDPGDEECSPVEATPLRREREASVALLWTRQRIRSAAWLRPAVTIEKRDYAWDDPAKAEGAFFPPTAPDLGMRLEAGRSSARGFALSVGPQAGYSLVSTVEGHRYTRALDDEETDALGYLRLTGRGRGYRSVPLGATRHVLALRGDAAADLGARSPGFDVGGANGGALPIALEVDVFGRGLSFPVRGYPEAAQSGNRALTGSAEYRFPVARVERGVGLLPVYLDRLTGDLFADAGTAWCAGVCPRIGPASPEAHPLVSLGAELLAELRVGYHTPLPLRLGVALPLRASDGPEVYLRLGRAF